MKTPHVGAAPLAARVSAGLEAAVARRTPAEAVARRHDEDSARLGGAADGAAERAFKRGIEAARSIEVLDELGARLGALAELVSRQEKTPAGSLDDLRARIDSLVNSINHAADAATGNNPSIGAGPTEYVFTSGPSTQLPPSPYTISNQPFHVESVRADAQLEPGQSLHVNVRVTASAQQAGFYLSFGGPINLSSATARFVIELAGHNGTRELSFASGTTVASIREAINSLTAETGLVARLSGPPGQTTQGIALKSVEFGEDQFVSVRVINPGGLNSAVANAGVYQLRSTNNNAAVPTQPILFSAASVRTTDLGQDIGAIVNGVNAVGRGRSVHAVLPNLQTQFRLSVAASQVLQETGAFTISRQPAATAAARLLDPTQLDRPGVTPSAEISLARERLAQLREAFTRIREEHRNDAALLLPPADAQRSFPIDAGRVRELLLRRGDAAERSPGV